MSKVTWNDEVAHAFNVHRLMMRVFGNWPLLNDDCFAVVRWCLSTTLLCVIVLSVVVEIFLNSGDAQGTLEGYLYLVCAMTAVAKNVFPRVHMKKLAVTMNYVMKDWSTESKESRTIMRKHANVGRFVTIVQIVVAYVCCFLFVLTVVMHLVGEEMSTSNATVSRRSIVPASWLEDSLTDAQYLISIVVQTLQIFLLTSVHCVIDGFFLSVVLHLGAQLEILKNEFASFGNTVNEGAQRKRLNILIKRHCELIELAGNIEDAFNFVLLFQLVLSAVVMGMTGLRILLALSNANYVEILQSCFVMNFMLTEALLLSCAGEYVQTQSEDIFVAIYCSNWYELHPRVKKDWIYIMMRTSIPIRLTGGKFFYLTRTSMMNIVKTAASYVSVLRVTLIN